MSPSTPEGSGPVYRAPDLSLIGDAHVRRYEETGGREGYLWNGAPTLVLTTRGRTSGEPRKIAIIYAQDGDAFILVASKGGAPKHPQWYLNLLAEPTAQVQVMDRKVQVRARTAEGTERERLWKLACAVWPNYDVYVTRTTRRIPVVVLERVDLGS